ncbi:MAG: glycosyltransferase family 4 protein [Trueperaceae bacterium]
MRALYVSTRLAGTDGVSLETHKVRRVLEGLGFAAHYCAGELDATAGEASADEGGAPEARFPPGTLVPEFHFQDPTAVALGSRAFASDEPDPSLEQDLAARASELSRRFEAVVDDVRPDLVVVQNAWAIPMQLPLAKALADVVARRRLPTLSHEHDYFWERERFGKTSVPAFLERYFPFHAPYVRHLAINSLAAAGLRRHKGVDATVVPNVLDFDAPAPGIDAFNADFREAVGLDPEQRLVLQPTRVVPRKGIELAIDLLAALDDARNVLVITHEAGDEGTSYLRALERHAAASGVDLRYVADRVAVQRDAREGRKTYALWDAYPHADLVTYPSLYEGFGNALLETIWFRLPAVVNRYPVYAADIAPLGFRFVELRGAVTKDAVAATAALLDHPEGRAAMTETNYRLARTHFSLDALRTRLVPELRALGFTP